MPFQASFFFIFVFSGWQLTDIYAQIFHCRCRDSNHRSLALEATALPTTPHPRPNHCFIGRFCWGPSPWLQLIGPLLGIYSGVISQVVNQVSIYSSQTWRHFVECVQTWKGANLRSDNASKKIIRRNENVVDLNRRRSKSTSAGVASVQFPTNFQTKPVQLFFPVVLTSGLRGPNLTKNVVKQD